MDKDIEGNEYTFKTPQTSDWGTVTGVLLRSSDKVIFKDTESGRMISSCIQPLLYVAGAYDGDLPEDTLFNIVKAEKASIELIRNGWHVFTPHKNTAGYERYVDGQITRRTWIDMDLNILHRCDGMYVLDNWRTSDGTKEEMLFANACGIPIYFEEDFPAADFRVPTDGAI